MSLFFSLSYRYGEAIGVVTHLFIMQLRLSMDSREQLNVSLRGSFWFWARSNVGSSYPQWEPILTGIWAHVLTAMNTILYHRVTSLSQFCSVGRRKGKLNAYMGRWIQSLIWRMWLEGARNFVISPSHHPLPVSSSEWIRIHQGFLSASC